MVLGTIDIIIPNGVLLCISKKTPNTHGRIRLSIVDNYYDKVKKMFPPENSGVYWLVDELEKQYDDPIAYFTKRVAQLNEEKQKKQAPINFTFYNSDRLCVVITCEKTLAILHCVKSIMSLASIHF